jgi:hypothetical protein
MSAAGAKRGDNAAFRSAPAHRMLLAILALVLAISIVPVKIGASVVGAKRDGLVACFVALVLASLIGGFAARHFHLGGALSVFVAALVYMLVLDTTYLRGLGVACIQFALSIVLLIALSATAVGPMLHRVMR